MNRLKTSIRDFQRDERGVLLAETLMMMPMLIWGFLALFVYWDVFRTVNVTQKAAYSISDLLSRQVIVNTQFIDGLQGVLTFLTPNVPQSRMRITSLEMDEGTNLQPDTWDADDQYVLLFSRSPGSAEPAHTQASIQAMEPMIPNLQDLESVIVVETWVDFEPRFNTGILNFAVGVGDQTFTQFIVTRPRSRRVCLQGNPGCT
jgi:Flp pilus assembly protein TadG